MRVSIVIPVYNEERTISDILRRVIDATEGFDREIVVVNDGSTDSTAILLNEFCNGSNSFIEIHTSLINIGKGVSVRIGLEKATGDIILLQDADKELDPADIPAILEPLISGKADAVFGSRLLNGKKHMFFLGYLANKLLSFLVNVLYGASLSDVETGYKAFRREILEKLKFKSIGFEWEIEITAKLLRLGVKIHEVPILYDPRSEKDGKTIGWWDGFKAIYYIFKYRAQSESVFFKNPS